MKIIDIIEHTLTEDLSNFTNVGIPAEFAKNILQKFRIKHDVEIQEIDGKPKTSDIEDGDMIINLLPNGSVIAVLKVHIDARFRASYKEYHRLTFADGEFSREWTTKVGAATKGMTARGKFFRISNQSIRYSNNPDRDDKPTPDEIKDRSTDDPLAGQSWDIYNYMDNTFMPKMRQQMEAMVDDIYANLRKLDKNKDRWGSRLSTFSRNQQEEALRAAAAIEEIAKHGFTQKSMEQFLATFGKRHGGFASIPRNESELKKLLKNEPNARAKWAQIILRAAKSEHESVKKMVRAPVMNALKGEGIEESATAGATSAGNIASVANPTVARSKPAKKGRYGAPEAPQKKNKDGTVKNALDIGNNLMGGKTLKR